MLHTALIKETERLLSEGKLSQRKIAAALGISRATVGTIAAGNRPDYEAMRRERASQIEPMGPAARCATCGGMVYTPCRLCRVRKMKTAEENALRLFRRHAQKRAIRRLLQAVHHASLEREAALELQPYRPTAETGASDCR